MQERMLQVRPVEDREMALRKKGRGREGIALRDAGVEGINARFEDAGISELRAEKDKHGHIRLTSSRGRGGELDIASRLKKRFTAEEVALILHALDVKL